MELNEIILNYAKEHEEFQVFGSTIQCGTYDNLSMVVPSEKGMVCL